MKIKSSPQYLHEYINSFNSIGRGLVVLGSIQAIFNVRLSETVDVDNSVSEIISAFTTIHRNQVYSYKVAISYGRILSRQEEDDSETVTYFHASANNSSIFIHEDNNSPYWLVDSEAAFRECVREIHDRVKDDTFRPNTKWSIVGNVNTNITLIRPFGGNLLVGHLNYIPQFLRQRGMNHFHRHYKSKLLIVDQLCFFRCLSFFLFKNLNRVTELFEKVYGCEKDIGSYEGVSMSELSLIETLFDINIQVFKMYKKRVSSTKEKSIAVKFMRKSLKSSVRVMNLNLHRQHFSLIVNMKNYSKMYTCVKCNRVFTSNFNLKRHTNIRKECTRVNFVYKGGVYNVKKSVFQRLSEVGIHVAKHLTIYPYKIVFDFESYFVKSREKTHSVHSATLMELDHVPLSASVSSDFPGYTEPVCYVRASNKQDDPLVYNVLQHINELGCVIGRHVENTFQHILTDLDSVIRQHKVKEDQALRLSKLKTEIVVQLPAERLKQDLLAYIHRVPVLGFNSGRYDLNLIKREFHSFFSENDRKEIMSIKRCNQYIAVYTEHLIFLDILNYLSPGYNYANYLKAFIGDTDKGIFPYNWMDNVRKLNNRSLPPRSAFYNTLTRQQLPVEQYAECVQVWRDKKMETFKDYLVHYNNLDVEPFVRAINAHSEFFKEREIDMFKDGLTLPGITLKFLFQNVAENATPYVLYSRADKDIHDIVRKNLVGGPSIIFHRHHIKGVSKIRQRVYGAESRVCEHVLGMDANSLYLKCLYENHCTGFYLVRRREENFTPKCTQQISYAATEWLRYRALTDKVIILHRYNYGEVRLGGKRIAVDGYVVKDKIVYQFHGCYWHGHTCHLTRNLLKTESGKNWLAERCQHTAQITIYLIALGYTVIQEYECRWLVIREELECQKSRNSWGVKRPNMKKRKMSENEIVSSVKEGEIFGLIEVDIHTPEHLKPTFSEMAPIFKNTNVSREDVGCHMKSFLEANDKLKTPQRQLIGSFFGEKILLGTPLLQWYLRKGLIVTKVYFVVEYTPEQTFKPFVEQVTEARRLGDAKSECKIISDLYKLLGNSSYGKTICNKQNFLNTRYVSHKQARRLALHWSVQQVHDISANTVEISCLPTTVTYDLPIQIGFMVYQYAKLKMLSFYFDFLLKFIDNRNFELCEMDTDSFYLALSTDNLDDAVYPDMREQYFSERHLWLPSESCDDTHHRRTYIACKTNFYPWFPQPCCESRLAFDKRTPGLFKVEWEGTELTALNSKCYIGGGGEKKLSCKGVIQRQNDLTSQTYNNVLFKKETHMVTNTGFKVVNHHMVTYTQKKRGLNYQYIKRKVCDDGVSTVPLDI